MYPQLPPSMTHTKSRAHLSSYLPTVYSPYVSRITAHYIFDVTPEDGHCQAPKPVVLYLMQYMHIYTSTVKYSYVKQVHTIQSSLDNQVS